MTVLKVCGRRLKAWRCVPPETIVRGEVKCRVLWKVPLRLAESVFRRTIPVSVVRRDASGSGGAVAVGQVHESFWFGRGMFVILKRRLVVMSGRVGLRGAVLGDLDGD